MSFAQPSKIRLDSADSDSPEISIVHSDNFETVQVASGFRFKVRRENIDPAGFFWTWVHKQNKLIQVYWFEHVQIGVSARLVCIYEGENAPSLYDYIITVRPSLSLANAVALGYDLAQAELELGSAKGP